MRRAGAGVVADRLKALTLRSRLLLAVLVVALVQLATAFLAVAYVSDELIDQVDERLVVAGDAWASAGGVEGGLSDVYRGLVTAEGDLVTVSAVSDRGEVLSPPAVTAELLVSSEAPVTVQAEQGEVAYRAVALESDSGDQMIVAVPLDGYGWTRGRLVRLVSVTSLVVLVTLGLVSWWLARLGIAPINRMTRAAERIASGDDLSQRIDPAPSGTEAGELGRALNTMMNRIEDSFRRRDHAEQQLRQFVADASHELRTPVATIRGYAELYRAGGLTDQVALDDAMGRVLQESERMSRLIADLLNLAKLDRQPTVRTDPVDLTRVAEDVVADAMITQPQCVIDLDTGPEPVLVRGDEDLLRQAVGNLVNNAIVHNPPGTKVVVRVRREPKHRGNLTVTDNGVGMAEPVASRATERFFRNDHARGRDTGGTGLGLSIVASIAAAHGGELCIESAPNTGTTTTLSIPNERLDSQRTASELSRPSEDEASNLSHAKD